MRASELRALSDDELAAQSDEAKRELFNLRFQRESGRLENLSRLRALRRDVARALTVMRERELAAQMAVQEDDGEQ